MDACEFEFPATKLVLFLFNPLPRGDLTRVVRNLERWLNEFKLEIWIVYHNPLLDDVISASNRMEKVGGGPHFLIYRSRS